MQYQMTHKPVEQAFFLGAGASISSGIPLTKQFIPYLFETNTNDERLLRLKDFVFEFFHGNFTLTPPAYPKFEQVLSFLDLAISEDHYLSDTYHHKYLRQLRSDLDYLIWRILEGSLLQEQAGIYQHFVDKTAQDSLFFTLNYDTLLDRSILRKYQNISYGLRFSSIISDKELDLEAKTPIYLKLHGSINWLYCPNCQSFYCYLGTEIRKIFGPQPLLCPYDHCYLKGILISPTLHRNYNLPPLAQMWMRSSKFLRNVKKITFIGYSLNDIDMAVSYLLKRSFFNSLHTPTIEVVDPDERIFRRYERLFGPIEKKKMTFEEFVQKL